MTDGPVLHDANGRRAVVLRCAKEQLPGFTLRKNTVGPREGFVTGLEPGSNDPNPKPFEAGCGRVVTLPPGTPYVAETIFEVYNTFDAVAAVEAEIEALPDPTPPAIHSGPVEPFASLCSHPTRSGPDGPGATHR